MAEAMVEGAPKSTSVASVRMLCVGISVQL